MAKKMRRHLQLPSERRGPTLEQIIEQVTTLREAGRLSEALSVLLNAPERLRRRPELLIMRGMLHMEMGDNDQAMKVLEEATQVAPRLPAPFFLLGLIYSERGWVGHALRMLRNAQEIGLAAEESLSQVASETEYLIASAEASIREDAEALGVSFNRMEEALHETERAERFAGEGEYRQSARYYHRAAELLPEWTAPRNAEAFFLFQDGSENEAIRICESILEKEPNDVQALGNLVLFHVTREEMDRAQAYADRIRALPLKGPGDLEQAIMAFGLLNEDETLIALHTAHRRHLRDLGMPALLTLGSAAANRGDAKLARRLWRRAQEISLVEEITAPYLDALERGAPGPGIATRYPTTNLPWLFPIHRLQQFLDIMQQLDDAEATADTHRLRKKVKEFVDRNPRLFRAAVRLLWEHPTPALGLDMLFTIGDPAAVAEIERFAFSQAGPLDLRVRAAEMLVDLGALDSTRPVSLWDEEVGEWRRVRPRWNIVSASEPPSLSPELRSLVDAGLEAIHQQQWDLAAEKFQAALALDPNLTIAHHNLAFVLDRQEDMTTAVAHLKRALEIDPDYVFARCTLALHYFSEDPKDIPAAQALLEPILEKPALTEQEMIYYHRALAELAMARERYSEAREYLDIALQLDPDNKAVQAQEEKLWHLEMLHSPRWAEMRERQRQHREADYRLPIHHEATLMECLSRLSREALLVTARTTPIPRPYKMRKAELIQAIAAHLVQPAVLGPIVAGLSETERQALRDVLEAGGTLPWEKFTDRYDNDLNESRYWAWYPPETTMGRLRMFGLLSVGTANEQFVVLLPIEMRRLLPPLLYPAPS